MFDPRPIDRISGRTIFSDVSPRIGSMSLLPPNPLCVRSFALSPLLLIHTSPLSSLCGATMRDRGSPSLSLSPLSTTLFHALRKHEWATTHRGRMTNDAMAVPHRPDIICDLDPGSSSWPLRALFCAFFIFFLPVSRVSRPRINCN